MTDEQLMAKFSELSSQIKELSKKLDDIIISQNNIANNVQSVKSAMPSSVIDTLDELDKRLRHYDYKFFKM